MDAQISTDDRFYRALMEGAVDPIFVIDDNGIILDINRAAIDIFGYVENDLIGRNVSVLMPSDEAEHHNDYISNYLLTHKSKIIGKGRRVSAVTKNGEELVCHLSVSEVNYDGNTYFVGILRDESELSNQQKKQALQADLLTKVNQWLVSDQKDIENRITSFLDILNESAECFLTTITLINTDSFSINRLKENYASRPSTPDDVSVERLVQCDVGVKECQQGFYDAMDLKEFSNIAGQQIKHAAGFPLGTESSNLGCVRLFWREQQSPNELFKIEGLLQACVQQLTAFLERQSILNKLRVSNDRFRRSQSCANIGTWDWNIESGELFWTERIAPLFGYPVGDLETSYENFLASVHPDDRAMVQGAVEACINLRRDYDIDHRVVWPDGSVHWVNEKGNVQRNANGEAIQMLGVVQDIQRAKDAEEQLIQARFEA